MDNATRGKSRSIRQHTAVTRENREKVHIVPEATRRYAAKSDSALTSWRDVYGQMERKCPSLPGFYARWTSTRSLQRLAINGDDSGSKCSSNQQKVAYQWDRTGWGTVFKHGNEYCCPKGKSAPLEDCHWVGKGDCADNTCKNTEVTLERDTGGDSYGGCSRACLILLYQSLLWTVI